MIASCFSAILINHLSRIYIKFPFTSLDDIWNQREYSLCVNKLDSVYNYIEGFDKNNFVLNTKFCKKDEYASEYDKTDSLQCTCSTKNLAYLSTIKNILWLTNFTKIKYNLFYI